MDFKFEIIWYTFLYIFILYFILYAYLYVTALWSEFQEYARYVKIEITNIFQRVLFVLHVTLVGEWSRQRPVETVQQMWMLLYEQYTHLTMIVNAVFGPQLRLQIMHNNIITFF